MPCTCCCSKSSIGLARADTWYYSGIRR